MQLRSPVTSQCRCWRGGRSLHVALSERQTRGIHQCSLKWFPSVPEYVGEKHTLGNVEMFYKQVRPVPGQLQLAWLSFARQLSCNAAKETVIESHTGKVWCHKSGTPCFLPQGQIDDVAGDTDILISEWKTDVAPLPPYEAVTEDNAGSRPLGGSQNVGRPSCIHEPVTPPQAPCHQHSSGRHNLLRVDWDVLIILHAFIFFCCCSKLHRLGGFK